MKTRIIPSANRFGKGIAGALITAFLICSSAIAVPAQPNAKQSPGLIGAPNGIGWNPGPAVGNNQMNAPSNPPINNGPGNQGNPGNPGGVFGPSGPQNNMGWNPAPIGNGNPWNYGGNPMPVVVMQQPVIPNQGITKVIACGYDAEGIWRVLPLTVSYQYNGVQYNVNVLNAWNPWTDQWDMGVDQPAYNTNYYLRGVTYDFYTSLSTGIYYFNL